jgi:hypothetical protein
MNEAQHSVHRTEPPSILNSILLTATGEATSQATRPETVLALGEMNVNAASDGEGGGGGGGGGGGAGHAEVDAVIVDFEETLPAASKASTLSE